MSDTSSFTRVGQFVARLIAGLIGFAVITACSDKQPKKLTLALPTADWWTAAPFVNSNTANYFQQSTAVLEVNSGLASKNAVVAGTADIGISAATPLALAAARNEKLVVLATYLRSSSIVNLVRPKGDVAGTKPPEPIALVPSTISESFLYQYLAKLGEQTLLEKRQLNELNLRPADIPAALKNGSAKSAVIWEPFLSFATQDGTFVREHTVLAFEVNLYILTRPTVIRAHPHELRAFLHRLTQSCGYLREQSGGARRDIETRFGFPNDFLSPIWGQVNYEVQSDRSRMKTEITREAEVAKALGYIKELPALDYLFEHTLPLDEHAK